MKFGVVVFPGSNCDRDCYNALASHRHCDVDYIWHESTHVDGYDCIILPGGYSYGDYLRPGAIASASPVVEQIKEHSEHGGLVLGICNGLLPGALMQNKNIDFICKYTPLIVNNNDTVFTNYFSKNQRIKLPIAHNDGNYYIGENDDISDDQIVFRYVEDVNGSQDRIAGIMNKQGNVLGMMPHPERSVADFMGSVDGLTIFNSIIKTFM